ncbi:MAG: hypothetical protein HN368_08860, partial [Spirochaetales bacterium]|nr:hypothetical protein [Spirochaetales bacterium]
MAADFDNDSLAEDGNDNLSPNDSVSTDDNELEQYGVWVKIGPEDVGDDQPADDFGLENLSVDDVSDNDFLTEEDEELLAPLEGEIETPNPAAESESLDELSDISLDDFTADIDLEEENIFDDSAPSLEMEEINPAEDELGNLADIELDEDIPGLELNTGDQDMDEDLEALELP